MHHTTSRRRMGNSLGNFSLASAHNALLNLTRLRLQVSLSFILSLSLFLYLPSSSSVFSLLIVHSKSTCCRRSCVCPMFVWCLFEDSTGQGKDSGRCGDFPLLLALLISCSICCHCWAGNERLADRQTYVNAIVHVQVLSRGTCLGQAYRWHHGVKSSLQASCNKLLYVVRCPLAWCPLLRTALINYLHYGSPSAACLPERICACCIHQCFRLSAINNFNWIPILQALLSHTHSQHTSIWNMLARCKN